MPSIAQAPAPDDPTAPLRRFPFAIMVKRPGLAGDPISILHVPVLRPKDQIFVEVEDKTAKDWTFVEAFVSAAQKIQIKSWNLWDKKFQDKPIEATPLPDSDTVPLFFLVLNKGRDGRVLDAVRHSLEIASEPIISDCATFETAYDQQNRLYNFLVAYGALGPKQTADPVSLNDHIDSIDADLGVNYNPYAQSTQPGDLQKGLDAAAGTLNVLRETPDNPQATAQLAQSQLPGVVSDWISLVGDLVHIFFRPPKEIKLTFIPASATKSEDPAATGDSMELLTQRVCETKDSSLPTLVYRPIFERSGTEPIPPIAFASTKILANDVHVEIPLAPQSRDLFLHQWAWGWQISLDGHSYTPIEGARLVPGSGLVFPISGTWWGGATQKQIYIKAHVGFQDEGPVAATIGLVQPQKWTASVPPDLAVGDPSAEIKLDRSGPAQPFYDIACLDLTDSAGKEVKAANCSYESGLDSHWNLANVAPGPATIKVYQMGRDIPDEAVPIFIQPQRPDVDFFCGKSDSVLRIAGKDAMWVQSVQIPSLSVRAVDDAQPGNRQWTMSAPIPPTVKTVTVDFKDPASGLKWQRDMPLVVGQPRPRVSAVLLGAIPATVNVGSGPDPSWAVATMPDGWFDSKSPIRIQLGAVAPFTWSHDVALDLGLGSAGDVQKVATVPEGNAFAMDERQANAFLTMNLATDLPHDATRTNGLVWVRVSRNDLSSPWVIATAVSGAPLRAVALPSVDAIDINATRTHITFGNVDQLLGVKFAGVKDTVTPQLVQVNPQTMEATVDGPPNALEFDLELRDADDGAIHVKIVKVPGK